jgi:DNA polymerase theta
MWLNQLRNIYIYIHTILEVVGEIIQTATDILRYIKCTLLNSTKPFKDMMKSAHESLR